MLERDESVDDELLRLKNKQLHFILATPISPPPNPPHFPTLSHPSPLPPVSSRPLLTPPSAAHCDDDDDEDDAKGVTSLS